jgi:hypothetical protein
MAAGPLSGTCDEMGKKKKPDETLKREIGLVGGE